MSNSKAYFYLIKILSSRDYSEHKLREKLRERKYPASEIDEVINEIKAKGYLKEDLYTEARIKGFMHKGYSIDYIRQKLQQEKLTVPLETIGDIFEEYRITEDQQVERLALKKIGTKIPEDFEQESKILRYLISKGHDFSRSKRVLKGLISNLKAENASNDLMYASQPLSDE